MALGHVSSISSRVRDNGGRITFEEYHPEKTVTDDNWRHSRISALPVNPALEPMEIELQGAGVPLVIAEYVDTTFRPP